MTLGISFQYTLDRLLSHKKKQTRRVWKTRRAQSFVKYFWSEEQIPALDMDLRRRGRPVGRIVLTKEPHTERLLDISETDISKEGYPELSKEQFLDRFFRQQIEGNPEIWVLDFVFIPKEFDPIGSVIRDENGKFLINFGDILQPASPREIIQIARSYHLPLTEIIRSEPMSIAKAIYLFKEGEITEGHLCSILKKNRLEAREIIGEI